MSLHDNLLSSINKAKESVRDPALVRQLEKLSAEVMKKHQEDKKIIVDLADKLEESKSKATDLSTDKAVVSSKLDDCSSDSVELKAEISRLKTENERLKAEISQLKQKVGSDDSDSRSKSMFEPDDSGSDSDSDIITRAEKYLSTLEATGGARDLDIDPEDGLVDPEDYSTVKWDFF